MLKNETPKKPGYYYNYYLNNVCFKIKKIISGLVLRLIEKFHLSNKWNNNEEMK